MKARLAVMAGMAVFGFRFAGERAGLDRPGATPPPAQKLKRRVGCSFSLSKGKRGRREGVVPVGWFGGLIDRVVPAWSPWCPQVALTDSFFGVGGVNDDRGENEHGDYT